jgi:hypothetical protein
MTEASVAWDTACNSLCIESRSKFIVATPRPLAGFGYYDIHGI